MKHKHYEALVAYANGEKIQVLMGHNTWVDADQPMFAPANDYRVKPKEFPKTTLTYSDLCTIANSAHADRGYEGIATVIARNAANEAIKHFIESGEMLTYFMNPENGFMVKESY